MKIIRTLAVLSALAIFASCIPEGGDEKSADALIISEIDPFGDCIELYNSGTTAISLEGVKLRRMRVKDALDDEQTIWKGAPSLKLGAGEYLVLTYEEGKEDELVYPRNLRKPISSKKNIYIWLQDSKEKVLCTFQRGEKGRGWGEVRMVSPKDENDNEYSFSLLEDGSWALANPTPGAANGAKVADIDQSMLTVAINEIILSESRVELHNYGSKDINISGFQLRWGRIKNGYPDNQTIWTATSGTIIPAGGYMMATSSLALTGYNVSNIHIKLRDPNTFDTLNNAMAWDDFKRGKKGSGWTTATLNATTQPYIRIPDGTGLWYLGASTPLSTNGKNPGTQLVPDVDQD
ncbi:MAG: hypothetical protein IJS07_04310 [Bacteroidales bacterium]|nr:hypothetical protein [Bacteroidales bacterium]